MILLIILVAFFLLSLISFCFVALTAIAYRNRARHATQAANRNAGYWAEAEQRATIAETELARTTARLETLKECYVDMRRIAGDAVKTAHQVHFSEPINNNWPDEIG